MRRRQSCSARDDAPLGRPHIPSGTRIPVPNHRIKWDQGNPTGHGWIFRRRRGVLLSAARERLSSLSLPPNPDATRFADDRPAPHVRSFRFLTTAAEQKFHEWQGPVPKEAGLSFSSLTAI
jgi:hypothetical protein